MTLAVHVQKDTVMVRSHFSVVLDETQVGESSTLMFLWDVGCGMALPDFFGTTALL